MRVVSLNSYKASDLSKSYTKC